MDARWAHGGGAGEGLGRLGVGRGSPVGEPLATPILRPSPNISEDLGQELAKTHVRRLPRVTGDCAATGAHHPSLGAP